MIEVYIGLAFIVCAIGYIAYRQDRSEREANEFRALMHKYMESSEKIRMIQAQMIMDATRHVFIEKSETYKISETRH